MEEWGNETQVVSERKEFDEKEKDYIKYVSEYGNKSTIMVETRYIGKIIGRGGSQINNIRLQTNTKIFVDKKRSTYQSETQIDIIGENEERENAILMINDICKETENSQIDPRTNYRPQRWNNKNDDEDYDFNKFQSRQNTKRYNNEYEEEKKFSFDWDTAIEESNKAQKKRWESK